MATEPIPHALEADGVWISVRARRRPAPSVPALFLDRDGVLVEEVGYLHSPADVRLLPGAGGLIHQANKAGVPVVVVTNQSGIGRGYYDWAAFEAVQERMESLLAVQGAAIDAVLACPFHPDARAPYRHPDHPCRKPNPGMLIRAAGMMKLDLTRSWMVADAARDVLAARAARLQGAVHVLTGHGERDRALVTTLDGIAVSFSETLEDVAAELPFLSHG